MFDLLVSVRGREYSIDEWARFYWLASPRSERRQRFCLIVRAQEKSESIDDSRLNTYGT